MQEEIDSLATHGTWRLEKLPRDEQSRTSGYSKSSLMPKETQLDLKPDWWQRVFS
jgi:hypothetical protein